MTLICHPMTLIRRAMTLIGGKKVRFEAKTVELEVKQGFWCKRRLKSAAGGGPIVQHPCGLDTAII
jgi:hypothetical protein